MVTIGKKRRYPWVKRLLILVAVVALLFLIAFVASYPGQKRLKSALILQTKCSQARSEIVIRKSEYQSQAKNYYDGVQAEEKTIQNQLTALSSITETLSYSDSTARVNVMNEANKLETRANEIVTASKSFQARSDGVANTIDSSDRTLYECQTDNPSSINAVKMEKYEDAINKAKQPVNLQP